MTNRSLYGDNTPCQPPKDDERNMLGDRVTFGTFAEWIRRGSRDANPYPHTARRRTLDNVDFNCEFCVFYFYFLRGRQVQLFQTRAPQFEMVIDQEQKVVDGDVEA